MKSRISSKKELEKNSTLRFNGLLAFHNNKLFELVNQDYGYPVEMLIKKIICEKKGVHSYPPNKENDCREEKYKKHDLNKLIELANLKSKANNLRIKNPEFNKAWIKVSSWDVNNRYKIVGFDEGTSADFIKAVQMVREEVMTW